MPTVIGTDRHIACKRHICGSCGRDIEVGSPYTKQRVVDGGEAWTWKAHPACLRAGQILWDLDIRGDEDALINVDDMDQDDRRVIYDAAPEIFHEIWPDRPAPSASFGSGRGMDRQDSA
jgi:hypothetical protein